MSILVYATDSMENIKNWRWRKHVLLKCW